jgi:hypothetical protein
MGNSGASPDQKGARRHLQVLFFYFLVYRSAMTETKKKPTHFASRLLPRTNIAFITSVSKFHSFGVTQDLLSFPDWLMAFHRGETVIHVNVLALLSSHKSSAAYCRGFWKSSLQQFGTPSHLSSTFVLFVLD